VTTVALAWRHVADSGYRRGVTIFAVGVVHPTGAAQKRAPERRPRGWANAAPGADSIAGGSQATDTRGAERSPSGRTGTVLPATSSRTMHECRMSAGVRCARREAQLSRRLRASVVEIQRTSRWSRARNTVGLTTTASCFLQRASVRSDR
jgi:hypothetical protein